MPSTNFIRFAESLVLGAGKVLLEEQKKVKVVRFKDRQDIATTADLASENYIMGRIKKDYPDHSILAEESGSSGKSDYQWVIDPLDGTKEYSRGFPLYCVAVSLRHKEEVIAAAVYRPADGNLYSASKNSGSFKNGIQVHTSQLKSLKDAFVYFYIPSYLRQPERYEEAWGKLMRLGKKVYRLRGLSDANSGLSWLASGMLNAYVNLSNPQPYHDIAAGLLIAKEAGAIIKDEDGKDVHDTNPDTFIAANNKEIYNQIMEVVS